MEILSLGEWKIHSEVICKRVKKKDSDDTLAESASAVSTTQEN